VLIWSALVASTWRSSGATCAVVMLHDLNRRRSAWGHEKEIGAK